MSLVELTDGGGGGGGGEATSYDGENAWSSINQPMAYTEREKEGGRTGGVSGLEGETRHTQLVDELPILPPP